MHVKEWGGRLEVIAVVSGSGWSERRLTDLYLSPSQTMWWSGRRPLGMGFKADQTDSAAIHRSFIVVFTDMALPWGTSRALCSQWQYHTGIT